MIPRLDVKSILCHNLQGGYIALLGQRGIGMTTFVRQLATQPSPVLGMSFISVELPEDLSNSTELQDLFLMRLVTAAATAPPEPELHHQLLRALENERTKGVEYRIRIALRTIGLHTSAQCLVLLLNALPEVAQQPLKKLLKLLREYHAQIKQPGQEGEKLRVLAAGGQQLWRLCCEKRDDQSPFNIAQRIFLGGLTLAELREADNNRPLPTVVVLRELTDGIPALIEQAILDRGEEADLTGCFRALEKSWNALSADGKTLLKSLATAEAKIPGCLPDFEAPQIPKEFPRVLRGEATAWLDVFWAGFVRLRHRKLAWRSPLHRAFVLKHLPEGRVTGAELVKFDLADRLSRLEPLLARGDRKEILRDAVYLAARADLGEIIPVFMEAIDNPNGNDILQSLVELRAGASDGWIREVAKQSAGLGEGALGHLINLLLTEVNRRLSDPAFGGKLFPLKVSVREPGSDMTSPASNHPKVFISYSHDSHDHMDRVLDLSNRLRDDGIDCHIDQYEESPSEGWPRWTINQIEKAAFVLVVCTESYKRRVEGKEEAGKGLGAKWEGALLIQELYEAEAKGNKFFPVLLSSDDSAHIPAPLRSVTHYDLNTEGGYEHLYRHLTNQPRVLKPELGKIRRMVPLERIQDFLSISRNMPYSPEPSFTHGTKAIPQEASPVRPNRVKQQRTTQLEGLLEIEYEKLNEFQKEIAITASAPEKFELRQRLKREVLPDIRMHVVEYAELLADGADPVLIPEADAEKALVEVVQAVEHIERASPAGRSDELTRLLTDIREKLEDSGKAAAAKLKIALPIIPLIASYELEMDTEAFMVKAWRRVKSLFGGRA